MASNVPQIVSMGQNKKGKLWLGLFPTKTPFTSMPRIPTEEDCGYVICLDACHRNFGNEGCGSQLCRISFFFGRGVCNNPYLGPSRPYKVIIFKPCNLQKFLGRKLSEFNVTTWQPKTHSLKECSSID